MSTRQPSRPGHRPKQRAETTKTFRGTARNLAFLARQLRQGKLVAVPTETVYGLAANALDAKACRRIFAAKRRPATDPLIVHLNAVSELATVCIPNASALTLARAFWPGPLTLVLLKRPVVPDVVTAGKDSVAVRVPAHRLFRRLLKLAGLPLAAPSANPFGYVSPTTAAHVQAGLDGRIPFILDGGATSIGLESTIVDLRNEKRPTLLRPGAITQRDLERVLRRRVLTHVPRSAPRPHTAQVAPGMLARHYSPRTPLTLHEQLGHPTSSKEAFLYFRRPNAITGPNVFWLDERGRRSQAAKRLFSMLRQLDDAGFRVIHAELAPGDGLSVAINDRLRRAAAR